jgi:BlaI family penicillinase repressor
MSALHVTDAESAVLKALWRCGPLPPMRLIAEVKASRGWGEATIKTLLGRLMHKKAIRSERQDGVLRYHALVGRSAYAEHEVGALIDRAFDGDAAAFVAFVNQRIVAAS